MLLATASLAINLVVLGWIGVRPGPDTQVFSSGAAHLLAGVPLEGKEASYLGYSLVLAAVAALGLGTHAVVALKIGVAALATAAVYGLGRRLGGSVAGVFAAAFFAADLDIARWHVYLLTDSLYLSLVTLAAWAADRAVDGRRLWRGAAIVTVLCAALVRPNGWLLVPIVGVYWIAQASFSRRMKWAAAVVAVLMSFGLIALVGPTQTALNNERPDEALRDGIVMWAPQSWRVPMPADGVTGGGVVSNAAGYAWRHPLATARLAAARVVLEILHVRPFYSVLHNAIVLSMLVVMYPLAIMGCLRWRRRPLAHLMMAVIAADLVVVAATFADWDGRFLLHTFALMIVFAAAEAAWRLGYVPDGHAYGDAVAFHV